MIDLDEDVNWSNCASLAIFANVAHGTRPPRDIGSTGFGFSRLIGNCGEIAYVRDAARVAPGVFVVPPLVDPPQTFAELPSVTPLTNLKTLFIRPTESLAIIK